MRTRRRRVLLLVVLVLGAAAAALVARRHTAPSGRAGFLPDIGGDTWPPVPVKDARPA